MSLNSQRISSIRILGGEYLPNTLLMVDRLVGEQFPVEIEATEVVT